MVARDVARTTGELRTVATLLRSRSVRTMIVTPDEVLSLCDYVDELRDALARGFDEVGRLDP